MTSIPPTSSSPTPEDSIKNTNTTQTTHSTTEENQTVSKKDSLTDEATNKVIAMFCNSPYINDSTVETMEENPDDVMKGVKIYAKDSKTAKDDLKEAQSDSESVMKAYEPAAPEGQYPNQTSKQTDR
jgi:predicted TIM-barrel fold metal-dependent hydrolase